MDIDKQYDRLCRKIEKNKRLAELIGIFIGIVLLCAVGLLIWYLLINKAAAKSETVSQLSVDLFKECLKFFIQFIFLAVFATVSVQEYNRLRQKKQDLYAFKKMIGKTLTVEYIKIKRLRVEMKNHLSTDKLDKKIIFLDRDLYLNSMTELANTKAVLETLRYEIAGYSKIFLSENKTVVKDTISKMENYLDDLLIESRNIKTYPEKPAIALEKFLLSGPDRQDSPFKIEFGRYLQDALNSLGQYIAL